MKRFIMIFTLLLGVLVVNFSKVSASTPFEYFDEQWTIETYSGNYQALTLEIDLIPVGQTEVVPVSFIGLTLEISSTFYTNFKLSDFPYYTGIQTYNGNDELLDTIGFTNANMSDLVDMETINLYIAEDTETIRIAFLTTLESPADDSLLNIIKTNLNNHTSITNALALDQTLLDELLADEYEDGYVAGYNIGETVGYNNGYNDSNNMVTFTNNIDNWIVPVVILVLFGGGFFGILAMKRDRT